MRQSLSSTQQSSSTFISAVRFQNQALTVLQRDASMMSFARGDSSPDTSGAKLSTASTARKALVENQTQVPGKSINIHCRSFRVGAFDSYMGMSTWAASVKEIHIKQVAQETKLLSMDGPKNARGNDCFQKTLGTQASPQLKPAHLTQSAPLKSARPPASLPNPQVKKGSKGQHVSTREFLG